VDYAISKQAVILFDAAYEAFIGDDSLPRSIYSIEGAKQCAIEFCSLSKTAGFTGTRCGYTIVPKSLVFETSDSGTMPLHKMWNRRQTTKFNGVPYIVQKGAAAVFTPDGIRQAREMVNYYKGNAKIIADTLTEKESVLWRHPLPLHLDEVPQQYEIMEFFDYLSAKCQCCRNARRRFWRKRGRLVPFDRIWRPRENERGDGAVFQAVLSCIKNHCPPANAGGFFISKLRWSQSN
jgi:LL-diaminopimelate aminotransferase